MTNSDYIIQSERLHNKARWHKIEIYDDVLAYRLLNNANFSESHKQLFRSIFPGLRYAKLVVTMLSCFYKY